MHVENSDSQISDVTPFALSGDMLRLTVLNCNGSLLGKSLDLLNSCELVLDVHKRLEGQSRNTNHNINSLVYSQQSVDQQLLDSTPAISKFSSFPISSTKGELNYQENNDENLNKNNSNYLNENDDVLQQLQLRISGIQFQRDGILLSPAMIWGPLLKYILMETKRREDLTLIDLNLQHHNQQLQQQPDDVEKLINILQRSENHILASRIIQSTWSAYHGKRQVIINIFS